MYTIWLDRASRPSCHFGAPKRGDVSRLVMLVAYPSPFLSQPHGDLPSLCSFWPLNLSAPPCVVVDARGKEERIAFLTLPGGYTTYIVTYLLG